MSKGVIYGSVSLHVTSSFELICKRFSQVLTRFSNGLRLFLIKESSHYFVIKHIELQEAVVSNLILNL